MPDNDVSKVQEQEITSCYISLATITKIRYMGRVSIESYILLSIEIIES